MNNYENNAGEKRQKVCIFAVARVWLHVFN